jgi:uncharacterized membrane protein
MIKLETLYILAGLMFAAFALFSLQDRSNPRRLVNFLFWGIYAITFMFGAELPNFVTGCLAIALALIAGSGKLRTARAPLRRNAVRRTRNASAINCSSRRC